MVCVTAQLASPNVIAGWPKFKLTFNRGIQQAPKIGHMNVPVEIFSLP